jgi:ribosomal protein S18 acetylase RimI-like enzyme
MARLRQMREDEYPAFERVVKDAYIRDMVESGFMSPAEAKTKADSDLAAELPNGLRTANTYVYAIQDDSGSMVGHAFVGKRVDQGGAEVAFIYDIWLDRRARGKGLGRDAMVELEDEVRGLGLTRMRLNVFGHNKKARELYRSLGYEELSILMGKSIDP